MTQTDFDPQLLRTFLAVATTLSFTRAAAQLGRSQPTVSQQVRRLEDACGRQLVIRDTRAVALTDNGEAMAGFARTILAAQDEAVSYFTGSAMRGRLRFGAADELALSELPSILRDFRQLNPRINLELTVTQSGTLLRRLAANSLDLIFVNQEADSGRGRLVRRDRLVWVGIDRIHLDEHQPVPLITYPAPSFSRTAALACAGIGAPAGGGSPATPARSTECWRPPGPESASASWPRAGCRKTCGCCPAASACRLWPTWRWRCISNPRSAGWPDRGAQQVDLEPAPGAVAPLSGGDDPVAAPSRASVGISRYAWPPMPHSASG